MSQSKTLIQGLDAADNASSASSEWGTPAEFYSNSGKSNHRGTVVPGMKATAEPAGDAQGRATSAKVAQSGKPIVGFLYSVSRTPFGEYWPLKIGPNTIGLNPECDIVLPEGTVSGEHAVLVVRQIKNTGSIIAAIADEKSTNGTMINGETIGFSAEECKNGDVITIGNNYELVLILIDAAKMNLAVSKDFIPVEIEDNDDDDYVPHDGTFGNTRQFNDTQSFFNENFRGGTGGGGDDTVGMSGFDPRNQRGGTKTFI